MCVWAAHSRGRSSYAGIDGWDSCLVGEFPDDRMGVAQWEGWELFGWEDSSFLELLYCLEN